MAINADIRSESLDSHFLILRHWAVVETAVENCSQPFLGQFYKNF